MLAKIKKILKYHRLRQLRKILWGYGELRKSNATNRIIDVRRALECAPFVTNAASYSRVVFGHGVDVADKIVRQYLLQRFANFNFGRALLYSLGNSNSVISYPLPSEWRKTVSEKGFKISKVKSAIIWQGYIFLFLCYGMFCIAKTILISIKEVVSRRAKTQGRYVHFMNLTAGQLPQSCGDGRSHDIVTWYARWAGRFPNLDNYCHDVPGAPHSIIDGIPAISVRSAIPLLSTTRLLVRYIAWAVLATGLSILDLFRGRWWHALMLSEAALSARARLQNPAILGREYLFHNSNHTYRPMWTYDAEKSGSRITFYFYSTNCEEGFKRMNGYPPPYIGWRGATWPRYLVWDDDQAGYVRRAVATQANIDVVGSIWFNCSANDVPAIPLKSFAVFDVQPVREAFYRTLGIDFDYYIPANSNSYITDIHNALKEHDTTLVLKRKRNIGKLAHCKYRNMLHALEKQTHYATVDSDIPAQRVIEKCIGAISTPFTSTALLARELGKPSIYYDPNGMISKDDRSAHGIPVISGAGELKKWIRDVINQTPSL